MPLGFKSGAYHYREMRFAEIAAREPISDLELVAPEPTIAAALSRVHERLSLQGDTSGPTLRAWDSSAPPAHSRSGVCMRVALYATIPEGLPTKIPITEERPAHLLRVGY